MSSNKGNLTAAPSEIKGRFAHACACSIPVVVVGSYHDLFTITFFVAVPPVCQPKGVKVYGVAKMETAHIACNVEANPLEVSFRLVPNIL